jgi:S-adenosylmethionine:tRNA ribosyltransferase-isomerase
LDVALFDFDLPRSLIAQRPASPRDAARLLAVDAPLTDDLVRNLPNYVRAGDVMVCNDTRVIAARLSGRRGAVNIDVTLHKSLDDVRWAAFARPAKRLKPGDRVRFAGGLEADVVSREGGEVVLHFNRAGDALSRAIEEHGAPPLPPYITRSAGADEADRAAYQTIFARVPGAVAAPTAGLHFTPALLDALRAKGVDLQFCTLHVGAGTFLPVSADDTDNHKMHAEFGRLEATVADAINRRKEAGGRVIAIGSTSLRLLEAAADPAGKVAAFAGEIDSFLLPGYRFRAVDRMLTNFHLPRSTLFMLVCAFAGTNVMQAAYRHAIQAGYRFYSYGDACLLGRAEET